MVTRAAYGGGMELSEAIRRRRMVRAYDPARPVPDRVVDALLASAIRAPSAGFSQGWAFLVLDTADQVAAFWRTTAGDRLQEPDRWLRGMMTAPVVIVPMSHKDAYLERYAEPDKGWTDRDEARWPVPYWHVDTGMAALILLLAAHDIGLAGCFFGVPPAQWPSLFAAFDVPAGLAPVGVVSLGYPAPDRRSPSLKRGRRQLAEVVSYGSFD